MDKQTLWSIGSPDGRSQQLVDNYKQPDLLGDVVWDAAGDKDQKWPLFHPSEADPDAGYRLHPYSILFNLDHEPQGNYALNIQYLVIAPRLAHIEFNVNGTKGRAYLRPSPSQSGEIRFHAGLHTSIYSEGTCEVVIPASLLRRTDNKIEIISCDSGDYHVIENVEKIKRLDRMANGAGFIYQSITFSKLKTLDENIRKLEVKPSVLYQETDDGKLAERCYLYLELNGSIEPAELELALNLEDCMKKFNFSIPRTSFGHLCFEFQLPDGEGIEVPYSVDVKEGRENFNINRILRRRRKWKVFLTPHAHTDIGYTHRQWEVAERLCRNIDTALDLLEDDEKRESSPSFAYHLDASWVLDTYLGTRNPQRIQQFIEQVKAGKIGIPHSYADLLTQYASLESLIRNGEKTEAFLRPEGLRSEFTSVVDVPSMTGSLPSVLAGSGVKYLVHANNQDRGPFRLNGGLHKYSPFYWEGAAGGKVLVWLAKMYCELRKVCGSPPVNSSAERGLEMWLEEYDNESYHPDAVLLYGQEADNTDIDPQPADFVRNWNETFAYPQLIPCDVQQFFEYVESNFGSHLHTVKGDGGAYWEDGAGSTIQPTMKIREAQAMLPASEKLESLAVVHNPDGDYPEYNFNEAWQSTLQFVEHTWGAFLSGPDPDALLQHDQWEVKEHFANDGYQWAKRLLHSAASRHSLNLQTDGREVVAYNPHSWEISGPITVEIAANEKVTDPVSGSAVPVRTLKETSTQKIVELWIETLSGLSYRRLLLTEAHKSELRREQLVKMSGGDQHVSIQNRYYKLTIDLKKGAVSSLFDKQLNRQLVEDNDDWAFGQLLYAAGGEGTRLMSNQNDLPDGNPEVLGDFELIDCGTGQAPYGSAVIIKGTGSYGEVEIEWLLREDTKRVDLQFTCKKQEQLKKEAVYVAFPTALRQAEILSDSQLGWVNWDKDELPGGCKEWLPLQTGILLNGKEADIFIASPDVPLFTVGDVVRGRWPKSLDLTGGRVFSYVLNNYWHTNYKASQAGKLSFRYSITSGCTIEKDEAFRFGWGIRRPLYGQRISFQDFRKPRTPYVENEGGKLAEIDSEQVILSTMKKAKWDDGWLLRFQEIGGSNESATVSFPDKKIVKAWETDLLERDNQLLTVNANGSLTVKVTPWGLRTVRILFHGENSKPIK